MANYPLRKADTLWMKLICFVAVPCNREASSRCHYYTQRTPWFPAIDRNNDNQSHIHQDSGHQYCCEYLQFESTVRWMEKLISKF